MTATGVLFDFSGTLLRVESTQSWLEAVLDQARIALPTAERERLAAELADVGALPGGPSPREVPPSLRALWNERDRDSGRHRELYTALARQVPLPRHELYDALYERHRTPDAWQPYSDTAEVLHTLQARGHRIAVVSNVGWDVRPIFVAHGLDRFVDTYTLSYEHGAQKPEPQLFRLACQALEVDPRRVLMVGDDRVADVGAAAIGCAVHLVDHLPVDQRPNGLRPVLELMN